MTGNSRKKGNGRGRGKQRTRFTDASFAQNIRQRLRSDDILNAGALRSTHYVFIFFAIIAAVFFLRLVFLQVIVAGEYSAQAEESRTINFEISARRGTIYDRNGEILATSVDATTIYCNPTEVTDAKWESEQIQRILEGNAEDYEKLLSKDSTSFVYVKRQADVDKAEELKSLELDGIYFISDSRREYPHGATGGQVIGVCDVDGNGISGLELQYDEILRGTPGKYSGERGVKGTPIPGGVHEDSPAIDGEDIMVSLDIRLQDTMEAALSKQVTTYDSEHGSSVVMDADTGEIYAICSYPYLDPTNLSESLIGSDNLLAVTQPIEPGSSFKSVSALTVRDADAMGVDDTIFAPRELHADEYVITDAKWRPDVIYSLRDIISKSSNVGISLATEKAGFENLYNMINTCKLSEKTGVDYPGEAQGSMPKFNEWAKITGYNISFGQGITVTPLQMTRFYGVLATGGTLVQPHFLLMKPQTGEWIQYDSEKVIDNDQAIEDVNEMLRGVVTDGTGKKANIDGFCTVGKTSTAEIAENGGYAEDRYNLAFVGFIDNSNSNLVCYVGVNDVIYEGNVAEGFKDIMTSAIEQYNIVPN
ncbi:penicillin-binding protein 2 [Adlercreutzia sp. ZJ304]|uniref:peptidoglycan D,D-transpeptidase FtsI family protein n=1 Tax=Adlercreutzia sp. ZJ304 TaxID=2709791 RepID=UPI0013E9D46E|nr:penicillin-binding protein 2 [Adlercreutzia sp. ZJ304]